MHISVLVFAWGFLPLFLCPVKAYTHDNVKALINNIFTTNSYNKVVRPSVDQSNPIILYVNLNLVGITDIDEVQEKMTSTAFLELEWIDDYMKWDPADYNGTDIIYVPQKDIWKPDIALENGFTKLRELGDDFLLTKILNDGLVIWRPFDVLETKCSIDIADFPFDKQTCDIKFGVWTSPLDAVDVEVGDEGILLNEYQSNGEWDLLATSAAASESAVDGAIVTFSLTVKRKPQYILYNVVFPIVMLSLLSVFVFALPADSGEKIGYIMTVYLAFAVFLTIVSASLPVSSTMSLLSTYLILLVCLGTAIVIITIFELRLHFRDRSHVIPKSAVYIVRFCKTLRCIKRNQINLDACVFETSLTNGKEKKKEKAEEGEITKRSIKKAFIEPQESSELTWQDVTSAVDFLCFWFFLLVNIVSTVGIFVSGYFKNSA
ncbi:neuronal acetylcholine receptor subunit beta-3-like [Ylistrum balloti]|uniref:neuronal acetylcholine receptor subunit beta-3-like n=1 Tax=Ylistrum balloti TaxID=509963 RepID=UPI002905C4D5|nr:neuronal acetylcholine receptor subunit beta-3-like [Ylistrum balloti]